MRFLTLRRRRRADRRPHLRRRSRPRVQGVLARSTASRSTCWRAPASSSPGSPAARAPAVAHRAHAAAHPAPRARRARQADAVGARCAASSASRPRNARTSATTCPTSRCSRVCGLAATVPHAPAAVREHAHYVTHAGRRQRRRARTRRPDPRGAGRGDDANCATRSCNRRSSCAGRALMRLPGNHRHVPHARILDRLVAWSPVLLLGALAALTYWLDAQVQPPAPRRDGSTRHDPDLFIEDFTRGDVRRARQAARNARRPSAPMHFPDDDSAELVEPRLSLYRSRASRAARHRGPRPHRRAIASRAISPATCASMRDADPTPAEDGSPSGPVTLSTESLHVSRPRSSACKPTNR